MRPQRGPRRPGATATRSVSGWPWRSVPGPVPAAGGAGGGAGTGTAAVGLIRVCGCAGASGPRAPVGSSSARPDRLARSDRRIERAAASISAASATPIRAAAGVAAPSGSRAGPSVTTPAPTTRARPATDRRPTVRHGSERPESAGGNDVPRWRPEATRPVERSGGVADIADHRTTERPKSHIQVTASYARTRPCPAPVRRSGALPHGRGGSRRRRTPRAGRRRG